MEILSELQCGSIMHQLNLFLDLEESIHLKLEEERPRNLEKR